MKGYRKLRQQVLKDLSTKLSPKLTYHGKHHTEDVVRVANEYIKRDKIKGRDAALLRIAALMHDIGFTITYQEHEEAGVGIARRYMNELGFSKADFKVVAGLIRATKVPQKPKTKLERILCDADLDYLGRKDFDPISTSLFQELKNFDILADFNEWNLVQVKFLENHKFHTEFAKKYRAPIKAERIQAIKNLIKLSSGG